MDPNEALRKLRELVAEARADVNTQGYVNLSDATAILDQFEALDEWLSRGGFPPEVWREGPPAFGEDYRPPELRGGESRLYAMDLDSENVTDLNDWVGAGVLVGIVDEEESGIVAYCHRGKALEIVSALAKAEAPTRVGDIPADWPVQPVDDDKYSTPRERADRATCGHCGLSWDDGVVTSMTPAPSGRCPFESFHI